MPAPGLTGLAATVDRRHALAHRFGITKTPGTAVVGKDGTLVYRGAISDWYADYGKKRARARHHWLRDALDAAIAGEKVATPRTEAVGCFLPTLAQ